MENMTNGMGEQTQNRVSTAVSGSVSAYWRNAHAVTQVDSRGELCLQADQILMPDTRSRTEREASLGTAWLLADGPITGLVGTSVSFAGPDAPSAAGFAPVGTASAPISPFAQISKVRPIKPSTGSKAFSGTG